ncbi:bifunctional helix-turn-helix transcriptional regulator/GNAT family N-acetyltransferase [Kordiimonas aestuarii]|uniref:bifunctional helix-turn-helix transcriptional regulator/GNAT family N-acetyltransferase n=1 Tax=Kordiimonas aestuarii TaxID=1005925 RepID=UPI0021CEAF53|nr:bifunctional helix-turn-helix transcriptional regulator/GNAT family N-acetyltransferase [Kordiimonas aestuarii]
MSIPDELFFELGIGTRMRRLSEQMSADADRVYKEAGTDFRVSYFYVIYALFERGSMPISEIARLAGFSHSAVSQTVKRLGKFGWVETLSTEDGRQKLVTLTDDGKKLVDDVKPFWFALERAVKAAMAEADVDLLAALDGLESALKSKSMYDRLREEQVLRDRPAFEIVPYDTAYRQAFYDLNIAWVRQYFKVEPIDEKVLSDPEGTILDKGGEIYFAVANGRAVGAVALKAEGDGRFELTKLGVDPNVRKGGMGRALCEKVIERFRARGGKTLYLETNTVLTPAIALYDKIGFVEMAPPVPSPYERANYYMEWREQA